MISKEEVKNIADLARIRLSNEEIEGYQKDLSEILNYVNKISEVDTSKIEPLYNISGAINNFHSDEPYHFNFEDKAKNREKFLSQAPQREGDYFKVKKIL